MNLTLDDKRTLFQILNLIMKADLVVKQEEVKFLDSVFNEFGLSLDEFDHMDDIDTDYLKKQFAHFTNQQKQYAKKLFLQMARCDGFVDPREMDTIDYFK